MDQVGIQNVKGFTPPASEHSKFVKEARAPYDLDDIRQLGWHLVDKQRLLLADKMRTSIPAIITAKRIDSEALKHGGISLRIGQGKAQRRTNDLFAKTILNWAAQIDSDMDTFGFAIATTAAPQARIRELFNRDHDSFSDVGQQIFSVPVTQVDVYHKRNLLGEHLWVVCQPPDMTSGVMRPVPIPDAFVFWRTPPDINGMPQSTVLSLLHMYQFVEEMKLCALQAARKRAAPPLVTERVESKKDPQLEGVLPLPGSCADAAVTEVEEITMKDKLMDRMVRLENTLGGQELQMMKQFASVLGLAATQIQNEMAVLGERLDLPSERKLVRQLQAEGPSMDVKQLEIHFEQVVLMAFGIPPGEIQPESTHGKMVSNDNIREVFNTHLSNKKQELVLAMEVMLRRVYQAGVAMRYALKYKASLVETIKQNTVIRVELPSIPEEKQMIEYYQMGMLKWEALRDYLSTKHVIPLECFEDKPTLTQMDLLTKGKPPETLGLKTSAAGSGKKTKKKRKRE